MDDAERGFMFIDMVDRWTADVSTDIQDEMEKVDIPPGAADGAIERIYAEQMLPSMLTGRLTNQGAVKLAYFTGLAHGVMWEREPRIDT